MNRKNLFLLLLICGSLLSASAQTLFTYGPYKAEAKDFLKAFNKNNTQVTGNKAQAMLTLTNARQKVTDLTVKVSSSATATTLTTSSATSPLPPGSAPEKYRHAPHSISTLAGYSTEV